MDILFYIRLAYFSASFFLPDNNGSYPQASGYRESGCSRLFSLSGLSVLYLDRSLFLLPDLSFSPWLSIYWWIVSTGTIFQDFFCSLWHLIVSHLSAIFHNHDRLTTQNENYYVHSLIAYFDRPIFKSILFFFSIIIYLLYQNKCFCDFLWIWADMLECAIHPLTYRTPLKKSLFCIKQYNIKCFYLF